MLRVWGLVLRVKVEGLRGVRFKGLGIRVSRFRVWELGFRIQGVRIRI